MRAHITHAIGHLLSHAPVQGTAALARLKSDLRQPSFPADVDTVLRFLKSGYLDRSKKAFHEALVAVLYKIVLKKSDTHPRN